MQKTCLADISHCLKSAISVCVCVPRGNIIEQFFFFKAHKKLFLIFSGSKRGINHRLGVKEGVAQAQYAFSMLRQLTPL